MTPRGEFLYKDNKRVMECVMVRRRDNGKLALPGGFIMPEEAMNDAKKRKFAEKALGSYDVCSYVVDGPISLVDRGRLSTKKRLIRGSS